MASDRDAPYLIIASAGHRLAIAGRQLVTIVDAPPCHRMPGLPTHAVGVATVGGESLPLYDFRRRIGLPAVVQEMDALAATLALRKQDHERWLENFRKGVEEANEVTVQTDPHLCAFGKWYDARSFSNQMVGSYMNRFDEPHQAIHALAKRAGALLASGQREQARQLVQDARHLLGRLVCLFDGVGEVLRVNTRPYAVVCEVGGDRVALLADELVDFRPLDALLDAIPWMTQDVGAAFTRGIGRVTLEGEQVDALVLDLARFVGADGAPPAEIAASAPAP